MENKFSSIIISEPMKRKTYLLNPFFALFVLFLILVLFPFILSKFYIYLLIEILIASLFAISTNILLGYTGLLSFGQSAYFGIGAYATALLLQRTNITLLGAILCSAGLSVLVALGVGFLCIRRRAFYFAILNLSFSQMFYVIAYKWINLTGGDDGIVGIPKPPILGIDLMSSTNYYYFTLTLVSISISIIYLIIRSPFGEILQAIRDNSERAEFSGVNITNYRIASYLIAGLFAGIAGAIFAPFQGIVTPGVFHWWKSSEPLLISILGGMYTFPGPVAGSVIFIFLKERITGFTDYWMFWYGLVLMFLIIYLPGGIIGFLSEKLKSLNEVTR